MFLDEVRNKPSVRFESAAGLHLDVSSRSDGHVFAEFFDNYDRAFVLPAEKEERSGFEACLALNHGEPYQQLLQTYGPFIEFVAVVRLPGESQIIGGINLIALSFIDPDGRPVVTCNLNYIFTTPAARGKGYFRNLLAATDELVQKLFPAVEQPPLIFVEQNDPFRMDAEAYAADTAHAGIDQFARLAKWAKVGAKVIDIPYVQPGLSADQPADDTLAYALLNPPRQTLSTTLLRDHLQRFFTISVFKGGTPSRDADAQLDALKSDAAVALLHPTPMLEYVTKLPKPWAAWGKRPKSLAAGILDHHRRIDGFEGISDRSMHFTLSLHVDNDHIRKWAPGLFWALSGELQKPSAKPEVQRDQSHPDYRKQRNQKSYPANSDLTQRLRSAVEPMFSDIADRERLGAVEDYLLAIPATEHALVSSAARISLRFDPTIKWSTEGKTYQTKFDKNDAIEIPEIPLRRFWYVHRNNSLSYHLSFKITGYEHTPQYFYLFSVLQKLVSPKEFELPDGSADQIGTGSRPDLAIFKALQLKFEGGEFVDFWGYIADLFNNDFNHLNDEMTIIAKGDNDGKAKPSSEMGAGDQATEDPAGVWIDASVLTKPKPANPWDDILKHEHYVDVPGLKMPNVRAMFYFADKVFQELLLPKLDDGTPQHRHSMLNEDFFDERLAWALGEATGRGRPKEADIKIRDDEDSRILGPELWQWLDEVEKSHSGVGGSAQPDDGPIDPKWLAERRNQESGTLARGIRPTANDKDKTTNLALCYLFLAGFNQNIIDFINQDASEVLDSLDPIYPFASDDVAEGFFVRYANPRTLVTYVRKMRSLNRGDEFIGTCPYAFLIHVLALHNEFLTRDFESKASIALAEADGFTKEKQWDDAAKAFYGFREGQVVEYQTFHYNNVFRYDTESKVFAELQRIRGIDTKHQYIQSLVMAAESRSHFNAERARRDQDTALNRIVFVIGMLALSGFLFSVADALRPDDQAALTNAVTWPDVFNIAGLAVGAVASVVIGWQLSKRWQHVWSMLRS